MGSEQAHNLKTWPEFFQPVWDGLKTAEIRKNDRGFAVADLLFLEEWMPGIERYTGRIIRARISHITAAPWLPDGLVMLSLADAVRAVSPTAPVEPIGRAAALLRACETINGYRHATRLWREDSIINWYTYPSTGSTASYWTLDAAIVALAGEVVG